MLNPRDSVDSVVALNKITRTLSQSIVSYLAGVYPRASSPEHPGLKVIYSVADDQRDLIDEIANLVMDRRGIVDRGGYPIEFTDLHDLSIDYLVKQAAIYHQRDLHSVEATVRQITDDKVAEEVGQRVLGAMKAHLELLHQQLAA